MPDPLDSVSTNVRQGMWFQQDNTSLYFTISVKQFYNQQYEGRWIPWTEPQACTDMTPFDHE